MIKINSSHISEFVGTFFLTAVVIGSGIMAENLSQEIMQSLYWGIQLLLALYYLF